MSKPYGLIVPNKNKPDIIKRPSIFDEDSDSDSKTAKKPTGISKTLKRQDKSAQSKAIEQDPTVYQYDEIYDAMDKKRKDSKLANKDVEKKPKYINMLLAAADRRKKDNERRIEREVQKEREAEGEMYKDKEAFVTSAYKKKLEERKILEEQEKREAYLESIGNVEKQGNLDGFYRHLYEQKVKCEDEDKGKTVVKEEIESQHRDKSENDDKASSAGSPKTVSKKRRRDKFHRRSSSVSQSDVDDKIVSDDADVDVAKKTSEKKRKYRRHKSESDSNSEGEKGKDTKKEHLPSNLDADSDFSIDSSDSEEDDAGNKDVNDKDKSENKTEKKKENAHKTDEAIHKNENKKPKIEDQKNDVKNERKPEVKVEPEELPPKKPKIDIWKKRTVGEVYEAAIQRYFMRKSMRESQQL